MTVNASSVDAPSSHNHGKARSVPANARRFYRPIRREDVGLERDFVASHSRTDHPAFPA